MKYLPWITLTVLTSLSAVACGDDDEPSPNTGTGGSGTSLGGSSAQAGTSTGGAGGNSSAPKDIVDTAVAAGSFKELAKALTAAGLVDALKGAGPFTVFAPTDAAFAAFEKANPGVLAGLTTAQLGDVLKYHVVAGAAVESGELKDKQIFTTLLGSPLLVDLEDGVKIGEASVTTADVEASNGVIHVIDEIILPPTKDLVETAVEDGSFTTLASALTSADLVETLKGAGPFTVFAPTDDAFEELDSVPTGDALKNVLLYHVVSGAVGSGDLKAGNVPTLLSGESVSVKLGSAVTVNESKVTTANIVAKNGVIHVIDKVLVP